MVLWVWSLRCIEYSGDYGNFVLYKDKSGVDNCGGRYIGCMVVCWSYRVFVVVCWYCVKFCI